MVAPPTDLNYSYGKIGTTEETTTFNARLLEHGEYRSRCINVRHAAGHSPDAITCSDTRAGADQNRSPAMFAVARSGGRTTSIGTKEPCSAEDHRNRDQHRNDAGSLVLTKTP